MRGIKKQEKTTHCRETKQSTEPDFYMAQLLELLDGIYNITMINMFKALMQKTGCLYDQMIISEERGSV